MRKRENVSFTVYKINSRFAATVTGYSKGRNKCILYSVHTIHPLRYIPIGEKIGRHMKQMKCSTGFGLI